MQRVLKFQKYVTWPLHDPIWPNFAFCLLVPLVIYMHANLKFLASTVPEIWRGSQNFKSRSRDRFTTQFDLILHFLENGPCSKSVCEIWREYLHRWPIYGYFTTSPIWLWNAYSGQFWGGFLGFNPLNVVWYCRDPQKAHPWPETRVLAYRSFRSVKKCDLGASWRKQKKERKETQRFDKSRMCPDHPRCATPTKVVMWGVVPDVFNHARFRQNWLRGFGSPRGQNLPFSYT